MTALKKQKPNIVVRLNDDLESYLREKAKSSHRTISGEIRMRLQQSREIDLQPSLTANTRDALGDVQQDESP